MGRSRHAGLASRGNLGALMGERTMRTLRTDLGGAVVALTVLACLVPSGQLRAEERDSGMRRQALRLNDITGMDPIRGEVQTLLGDKASTKKLLAEAVRMAKEKPQPFSYNATLILASTASQLKDYETAETFYRLHMDQAKNLLSVNGLATSYGGLITILSAKKKYAEAEELCKEALDLKRGGDGKDDKTLDRFQSAVMEQMIMIIARQGDTDRAIGIIDRILKDRPNNWVALDLKGDVLRIADKNKEAAKLYEDALNRL